MQATRSLYACAHECVCVWFSDSKTAIRLRLCETCKHTNFLAHVCETTIIKNYARIRNVCLVAACCTYPYKNIAFGALNEWRFCDYFFFLCYGSHINSRLVAGRVFVARIARMHTISFYSIYAVPAALPPTRCYCVFVCTCNICVARDGMFLRLAVCHPMCVCVYNAILLT